MKKLFVIFTTAISLYSNAQVAIGKNATAIKLGDGTPNPSVILSFSTEENKGVLLPWATSAAAVDAENTAVNGTFIFDTTAQTVKLKMKDGTWKDLSVQAGTANAKVETGLTEKPNAKVIIGASSSTAPGILVLESPDSSKAMILPTVNSYTDIINPSASLMVYVKNTSGNSRLAVYNGSVWAFWKP